MKISVIMVDGGFRENIYGAQYFSAQDFLSDQFEIIWVEYFKQAHPDLKKHSKVKVITLDRDDTYHSSYCFNKGIQEAKGELIVIPDADQIVPPDFLSRIWDIHQRNENLVVYGYRYDELHEGILDSTQISELKEKCILKNPLNYGGCITARRKWFIKVNGYEQHSIFRSGNHANGRDMYTRFKNLGLAIQWEPSLILFHPWHDFTLMFTLEHEVQSKVVEWRKQNMQFMAFSGIDPTQNHPLSIDFKVTLKGWMDLLNQPPREEVKWNVDSPFKAFYRAAQILENGGEKYWEYFYGQALNILLKKENKSSADIYRIGSIFKKLKEDKEAHKWFMDLKDEIGDDQLVGGALFHLGEMDYQAGHLHAALDHLNSCLERIPGHKKAQKYIIQIKKVKSDERE